METELILALLKESPDWLRKFPNVLGIEYFVNPLDERDGRGDLLLGNSDGDHLLVVELKKDLRRREKLLWQAYWYRDCAKMKNQTSRVDCAAVAGTQLVRYTRDVGGANMFYTRRARAIWVQRQKPLGLLRGQLQRSLPRFTCV